MYLVCNKWTFRNAFTVLCQVRIVFWCGELDIVWGHKIQNISWQFRTLKRQTNRVKSCISVCIYNFGVWNFEIWVASNSQCFTRKKLPTKRLGSSRYIKCSVLHIYFCATYIPTYSNLYKSQNNYLPNIQHEHQKSINLQILSSVAPNLRKTPCSKHHYLKLRNQKGGK